MVSDPWGRTSRTRIGLHTATCAAIPLSLIKRYRAPFPDSLHPPRIADYANLLGFMTATEDEHGMHSKGHESVGLALAPDINLLVLHFSSCFQLTWTTGSNSTGLLTPPTIMFWAVHPPRAGRPRLQTCFRKDRGHRGRVGTGYDVVWGRGGG
jgi:hypothetical protein